MTRNCGLKAIVLLVVLIWGALPALAQQDGYDERDESVAPEALAQFHKGERLAKNGQLDEAIAAFRQAIALQPDYAQAYQQLGLAYAGGNRYPEAVKAFKEAARLQPQSGQVHENLGVAYIKLGQWREARETFAAAIRLHPDNAEAHYNLGLANGKLNRDQEARAQFAEAIRLDPAMAKAHKNLGLAYLNLEMLDQARKSLQEAVRLDPKDPQAHYALCVYYARAGDTQAALTLHCVHENEWGGQYGGYDRELFDPAAAGSRGHCHRQGRGRGPAVSE